MHRHLEQQSWSLVEGVLNAEQVQEVRAAIDRWRAENPTTRSVAQVRFADLAALELRRGKEQQGNNSLFGFIGLIAYDKALLARPVGRGMTLGVLLGALVIVASWLTTWVYVRWANAHYDTAVGDITR